MHYIRFHLGTVPNSQEDEFSQPAQVTLLVKWTRLEAGTYKNLWCITVVWY